MASVRGRGDDGRVHGGRGHAREHDRRVAGDLGKTRRHATVRETARREALPRGRQLRRATRVEERGLACGGVDGEDAYAAARDKLAGQRCDATGGPALEDPLCTGLDGAGNFCNPVHRVGEHSTRTALGTLRIQTKIRCPGHDLRDRGLQRRVVVGRLNIELSELRRERGATAFLILMRLGRARRGLLQPCAHGSVVRAHDDEVLVAIAQANRRASGLELLAGRPLHRKHRGVARRTQESLGARGTRERRANELRQGDSVLRLHGAVRHEGGKGALGMAQSCYRARDIQALRRKLLQHGDLRDEDARRGHCRVGWVARRRLARPGERIEAVREERSELIGERFEHGSRLRDIACHRGVRGGLRTQGGQPRIALAGKLQRKGLLGQALDEGARAGGQGK